MSPAFKFLTGESAIHEACSKYNTTEFQAMRQEFQGSVREALSARYQSLSTRIDDLQVNKYIWDWIGGIAWRGINIYLVCSNTMCVSTCQVGFAF